MSRTRTKKKPREGKGKAKPKPKTPERHRPYWTLLLWLLAIGALLVVQTRRQAARRNAEVEQELRRLEQEYEDRLSELQLQVQLLESQLGSNREATPATQTAR